MTEHQQPDAAKLYSGSGDVQVTKDQMGPVAQRLLARSHLPSPQSDRVPAGYTFLAQLLAHEISSATPEVGEPAPAGDPARQGGLMLDSIFGPILPDAAEPRMFSFRPSAADVGRKVSVDLFWDGDTAVTHDDRNADTPMLSQLSALFVDYCLRARRKLRGAFSEQDAAVLSRLLTAELFHRILRNDLLPRILHPDVWALYGSSGWRTIDAEGQKDKALVPVEFSNAAFRFGHAMVRSVYLLNDRSPALALGELTRGVSGLNELRAVNSNFWRVDWRLFFGEGRKVQMSRRIGPDLPPDLENVTTFFKTMGRSPLPTVGKHDIALKDLVRGVGSGLQRVSAIADAMDPFLRKQPAFANWALWDAAARATLMRGWLGAGPDIVPDHLASDPPPYLYLLVESGAANVGGCGEGRTLGALGSVLTAEVVIPPLLRAEKAVAARSDVARARRTVLGQRRVPKTMPALINFLS